MQEPAARIVLAFGSLLSQWCRLRHAAFPPGLIIIIMMMMMMMIVIITDSAYRSCFTFQNKISII